MSGLPFDINTVPCINLSAKNFLNNIDVNATASFLHVNFSKEDLLMAHVDSHLFLRKKKTVKSDQSVG